MAGVADVRAGRSDQSVAGRTCWDEPEESLRAGYAALFAEHGIRVDAHDPVQLVLFPEMDEAAEVPEITEACWGILGVSPQAVMCANSRMVAAIWRDATSQSFKLIPKSAEAILWPSGDKAAVST